MLFLLALAYLIIIAILVIIVLVLFVIFQKIPMLLSSVVSSLIISIFIFLYKIFVIKDIDLKAILKTKPSLDKWVLNVVNILIKKNSDRISRKRDHKIRKEEIKLARKYFQEMINKYKIISPEQGKKAEIFFDDFEEFAWKYRDMRDEKFEKEIRITKKEFDNLTTNKRKELVIQDLKNCIQSIMPYKYTKEFFCFVIDYIDYFMKILEHNVLMIN